MTYFILIIFCFGMFGELEVVDRYTFNDFTEAQAIIEQHQLTKGVFNGEPPSYVMKLYRTEWSVTDGRTVTEIPMPIVPKGVKVN